MRRGLDFIASYLSADDRLHAVGSDGAQLFLEFALTSVSSGIRAQAAAIARSHARRLLPRYLTADGVRDPWDFANALEMLLDARQLAIPTRELAHVLRVRFRNFGADENAYGVPLTNPGALTDEQVFNLLLQAYSFERAAVALPGRFPVRYRLEQALAVAYARPLVSWAPPPRPGANSPSTESAYLATHVALVLTEYGRRPMSREWFVPFEAFLRGEFDAFLRADDIEIVGETADVLRQLGAIEHTDSQLCMATRYLLASQHDDGSWGDWQHAANAYDAIHVTWAAVTGLLERMRGEEGRYGRRIRTIVGRLTPPLPMRTNVPIRAN